MSKTKKEKPDKQDSLTVDGTESAKFSFGFKIIKKNSVDIVRMTNTTTRNAFYNLEILKSEDNSKGEFRCTATFGKIGEIGNLRILKEGTYSECRVVFNKRHREKAAKGYQIIQNNSK